MAVYWAHDGSLVGDTDSSTVEGTVVGARRMTVGKADAMMSAAGWAEWLEQLTAPQMAR